MSRCPSRYAAALDTRSSPQRIGGEQKAEAGWIPRAGLRSVSSRVRRKLGRRRVPTRLGCEARIRGDRVVCGEVRQKPELVAAERRKLVMPLLGDGDVGLGPAAWRGRVWELERLERERSTPQSIPATIYAAVLAASAQLLRRSKYCSRLSGGIPTEFLASRRKHAPMPRRDDRKRLGYLRSVSLCESPSQSLPCDKQLSTGRTFLSITRPWDQRGLQNAESSKTASI